MSEADTRAELRVSWGRPETRKNLLLDLEKAGFGKEELKNINLI